MPSPPSLVRRVRQRARREIADRRGAVRSGPLLSVVVPFYNVAPFLDATLKSIARQRYRHLEVVLVDDGSTDGSHALAQRWASADKRFRVVSQPNSGPSIARNTGIAHATGEFLTFVDSDDLLLPDGLVAGMASLQSSGSDLVTMRYERLQGRERTTPRWIEDLYAIPRTGVTIAKVPELLVHATVWSKIYRRDFWDASGITFTEGVLYEDQEVSARAQVAATAVDIVPATAYLWRHRPKSITREFSADSLNAFFNGVAESLDVLDAVPGARAERARQVLSNDIPHYIRALVRIGEPGFEQTLVERLPALLAEVEPSALVVQAPAEMRVALEYIRQARIDDLHSYLNLGGLDLSAHESELLEQGPTIRLPGWGDPTLSPELFTLSARQTPLDTKLLRARVVDDKLALTVSAHLRHIDAPGEPSARAWLTSDDGEVEVGIVRSAERVGHRLRATRESADSGVWELQLERAQLESLGTRARLEVEVTFAGRTRRAIVSDIDPESSAGARRTFAGWLLDGSEPFTLHRTTARSSRAGRGVSVADVRVDGTQLVVEFDRSVLAASMVSSRMRVDSAGGEGSTRFFTLDAPVWDQGELPVPVGDYRFERAGSVVRHSLASLTDRLPIDLNHPSMNLRLVRSTDGGVVLRVDKPRSRLAQSVYGQRRLRQAYRDANVEVDPNIAMFQSYWAETATDSPLAICLEMQKRRPGMQLYWGILDHSVPVPDGTIPVVAGSPDWYDVLARAKYLVRNTELGAYTLLRPGQVHVQTFHGQPFKTMGASLWRDIVHLPEFRVRYEATTRRSDYWSIIATPYEAANEFYRDNYFYEGPFHHQGLPRTDGLVGDSAASARDRTRRLLGIRDGQIAVLHAATWREDKAGANNTSRDVQFIDLEKLAKKLGPDYVILQRSHGSVARGVRRHGDRPGVIDVTDYPEINDLILASDAAIVDYSSLRFDYALTGRPMVFLVPDLERYEGELRGFLFDFRESAPGPLVTDQAGVLTALRDLDGLSTTYAEDYRRFNERYNQWHDGHAAERLVDRLFGGNL